MKVRVTVISTGLFSVNISFMDQLIYTRSPILGKAFSCMRVVLKAQLQNLGAGYAHLISTGDPVNARAKKEWLDVISVRPALSAYGLIGRQNVNVPGPEHLQYRT